jgi:hypothetical protein
MFPTKVVYFPEKEGRDGQGMWHVCGREEVHTGLLWGELMEGDPLGKFRRIWGDNIKVDL